MNPINHDNRRITNHVSRDTWNVLRFKFEGFRCNVFLFIPLIVAGGRLCFRVVMNLWNMLEQ